MLKKSKRTVLIFSVHSYPGVESGGPIRSLLGIIQRLSNDYILKVITFNSDHGSITPYLGTVPDEWQDVSGADVYYMSKQKWSIRNLVRIMSSVSYDGIYLNSFWEHRLSIAVILLMKLGVIPKSKILLAPRGEFSAQIRFNVKKKLWVLLARVFKLYNEVSFHVTSQTEQADVAKLIDKYAINRESSLFLVPNLRPNIPCEQQCIKNKNSGELRLVYIARIHPTKRLHEALEVLKNIKGLVYYGIHGPIHSSDRAYWCKCEKIIKTLPENILVEYHGIVDPWHVSDVLSQHHAFFMPTKNENYGHSIIEALTAGCPVVISDQTPWRNLEGKGIGWDVPFACVEEYAAAIQQLVDMDYQEYSVMSQKAVEFGESEASSPDTLKAYQKMFDELVENNK